MSLTDVMETATSIVENEVIKTQTDTPLPPILNAAFFTPIPTDTPTPTRIPTTATVTTEPVPFTSFGTIFMIGKDGTDGNIHAYPDDLFHLFAVPPGEIESFHFATGITAFHFTKNELTPTPTAIPTIKWQLLIYRYRTNETYTNQTAIRTSFAAVVKTYSDRLETTLSADVTMKDLQTKFGDCSVFTFQVIDEQGNIQQQGSFSINPHYLFFYQGAIKGNFKDGITIGYPYSLNENETEFFHQDKFITILESQGGFYRISYRFDFVNASGVSAVTEQEKVASQLSIRLFPYGEDGKYSLHDSHPATGFLHAVGGYFIVDLPIDYIRENTNNENKYYLQIIDGNGKIIKDEYFLFIPYAP